MTLKAWQSHMGSNSVGESILAGKPMIAWPFMGDQPEITQQSAPLSHHDLTTLLTVDQ